MKILGYDWESIKAVQQGADSSALKPSGFLSVPTKKQLRPTKRERAKLKQMKDWQKQSEQSQQSFPSAD